MWKLTTAVMLVLGYAVYNGFVYTSATNAAMPDDATLKIVREGKMIFQANNCAACHQIYGLGGYLGPDLTDVAGRYPNDTYVRSLLTSGNQIMPAYHFSEAQKDALIAYFKHLHNYAPRK